MPMPTLALDAIRAVTRKLSTVSPAELDALASEVGGALPLGYRAYLERFGRGTFSAVLYVQPPEGVRFLREEHARHRILEYVPKFWSNFDALLMPSDLARLCPIARSMDGDVVYFHLDDPAMVVVTPRHRDQLAVMETFEEALAWFSASGAYWEPAACPWFDSEIDRIEHEIAFDRHCFDDLSDLLRDRVTAIAKDAEVVEDRDGNAGLVFVPSADGVIEVFPEMLRVTSDRGAAGLAGAVRELMLLGDVPPLAFRERERVG